MSAARTSASREREARVELLEMCRHRHLKYYLKGLFAGLCGWLLWGFRCLLVSQLGRSVSVGDSSRCVRCTFPAECGRAPVLVPRTHTLLATAAYANGTRRFELGATGTRRPFARTISIIESRRARRFFLTGFAGLPGRTSWTIPWPPPCRAEFPAFVSERRRCARIVRVLRPSPTCRERARKMSW